MGAMGVEGGAVASTPTAPEAEGKHFRGGRDA